MSFKPSFTDYIDQESRAAGGQTQCPLTQFTKTHVDETISLQGSISSCSGAFSCIRGCFQGQT